MESTNNLLDGSKEFLNSNSFISKISFVILIIICFILLFNFSYWIISMFISPNRSPYLIDGMKDAKTLKVITQDIRQSGSIPIFRSRDQYNGVEMTWSSWIYIEDPTYNQNMTEAQLYPVFIKGTNSSSASTMGVMQRGNQAATFSNSNAPGVYLIPNNAVNKNTFALTQPNLVTMNLKILIDIFPFRNPDTDSNIFKQEIDIGNIPIRKWVSIILRFSTQNILDVFINGSLKQRVKLFNTVRQNYDDVFINPDGGFDGFVSNLRYFDYSIGTFEINQIVSSGPNLRMDDNTNIKQANPYYLSTKWLFGETNVS